MSSTLPCRCVVVFSAGGPERNCGAKPKPAVVSHHSRALCCLAPCQLASVFCTTDCESIHLPLPQHNHNVLYVGNALSTARGITFRTRVLPVPKQNAWLRYVAKTRAFSRCRRLQTGTDTSDIRRLACFTLLGGHPLACIQRRSRAYSKRLHM